MRLGPNALATPLLALALASPAVSAQVANWVEQLAAEGITAGCGGGSFCPNDPHIRGQMAVFLVKIFGLNLYGP